MDKQINNNDATVDMFGFEGVSLSDIEQLTEEQDSNRWPEAMRDMHDLLKRQLESEGADPAIAIKLLSEICKTFGGMQFYLPRGHHLEVMLIHLNIWNDFTGDNVVQLSRKYDVSMQHIYRVVAKMRKREIKKHQPELF
ncbi:transcriptional regulator [Photobacterium frigidiphilum]|uniref:Transcriptional regulator n=1 Tax=Photobacterium frigidiphilum TaxID=264736 RepID=A0A2T3JCP7_9GAMM|nr:Mor transcription activator family protein [Photobacterium frigidiphilum]PSU46648.1 transcriptional regulator [Photobacterium frigidiphilum]